MLNDNFTSLADIWTADKGTWSISSGQVNVDSLAIGDGAVLLADATLDGGSIEVKVTLPAGGSNRGGAVFSQDGSNNYYAVVLDVASGKIALYSVSGGSFGSALASASATISASTQYTIRVYRNQRHLYAEKVGESGASFTYDSSTDFGTGSAGLYANVVNAKFDDYSFRRGDGNVSKAPRWRGAAGTTVTYDSNGSLTADGGCAGNGRGTGRLTRATGFSTVPTSSTGCRIADQPVHGDRPT